MEKKVHSEFCEGHVSCPNTGKEECGKVVNWKVDGNSGPPLNVDELTPITIFCFGCNSTHNVKEE